MRNKTITLKLTLKEYESLKKKCNHLEMSLSEYIRIKTFNPDEIGWQEFVMRLKEKLIEEKPR